MIPRASVPDTRQDAGIFRVIHRLRAFRRPDLVWAFLIPRRFLSKYLINTNTRSERTAAVGLSGTLFRKPGSDCGRDAGVPSRRMRPRSSWALCWDLHPASH